MDDSSSPNIGPPLHPNGPIGSYRPLDESAVEAILETFLARRKQATRRTYSASLADFARWLGVAGVAEAVHHVLAEGSMHPGRANETAARYRANMVARRLSPATVNVRLAALRSLVAHAKRLGYLGWDLDVNGERRDPVRDSRGPEVSAVKRLLETCSKGDPPGMRDKAIIRLAFDRALRRGEIAAMDVQDVDLARHMVAVLGKGKGGRRWTPVPEPTIEVLRAWLSFRGPGPGPLFIRLDRAGGGSGVSSRPRITGEAIRRMVARRAREAGITGPVRPHGLRHTAITLALDRLEDLRKVQAFSRHADLRTLLLYDDVREALDGPAADEVASML